jgi:predicted lipid-binding transport protein (Tim44 family)
MKTLLAVLAAGALVASLLPTPSEAARVGGGRSYGTQRPVAPSAQKATPAPQQSQQAQQSQAQPAAAAPQAAGNRWMGPLAGLAAGLGLGWLLSQGGFGGILAAVLMALAAGVIVMVLLRLFMRPRAQAAQAGNQTFQYAAAPQGAMPDRTTPPLSSGTPLSHAAPAPASEIAIPKGFDAAGFLRQAKLNFIRLQEANDRGDLETLREVATEEMFQAITADRASGGSTDVANLEASLLEVTTEGDTHWASVRFSGNIREDGGSAAPFQEVWHLRKPVSGDSGWLLAGIQQVS